MSRDESAIEQTGATTRKYGVGMLVVLGFLFAMTALHINPIESSMPGMASELGGAANSTANVASAFFFGMMIGHLVIGPISDIIGRKKTILVGLVLLMMGAAVCAAAESLFVLIVGRAIQGLGGAAALCTGRAIGGDAGAGRASAQTLSLMEIISATVAVFMPIIGNTIAQAFGWRSVFFMMIVIDAVLAAAMMIFVQETSLTSGKEAWKSLLNDLNSCLAQPVFLMFALAFGFGIATFFCYTGASAFVFVNELKMSQTGYAILYSSLGITMVLGGIAAKYFTKRFEPKNVFRITVGLQFVDAVVITVLFATHTASVVQMAVCFALIAGGNAIVLPVGLALALNESGRIKGSAAAFCGFAQYCFSWLCTTVLSMVKTTGSIGMMTGLAMCVTACCAFLFCTGGDLLLRRRSG